MRYVPLLLLAACVQPAMARVRNDFLAGLSLQSAEHYEAAREGAREILDGRPTPGERVEALSILARTALETGRPVDADQHLAEGRVFFQEHDPGRTWPGDAPTIHMMKGDFFTHGMGGRSARDPAEAQMFVMEIDRGLTQYLLAESKCTGRVKSFVRLRLVRAFLDKAAVWDFEAAKDDIVYLQAARKALDEAAKRVREETVRPHAHYEEFRGLRKEVEERQEKLRPYLKD